MNVLYLSYDGALDPLGQSQILPYLGALARRGHTHTLISYEKPRRMADAGHRRRVVAGMQEAGIQWRPLTYHRSPPVLSTAWDLSLGWREAQRNVRVGRFDLVHVRSYPCVLIARRIRSRYGIPYVFDMRGFYAEERVDGGLWRKGGPLFRLAKRLEAGFFRDAAAVVTLTDASEPIVRARVRDASSDVPVHVIPTAVDLDRFDLGPGSDPPHLMYVGSVGTWYLLDEMVDLAARFLDREPGGRVTFLVNGDATEVRAAATRRTVADRIHVRSTDHAGVAIELQTAAATMALIRPSPSKVASAPTKFAESLAAGAPVIVNAGVGDVSDVVHEEGVGVVFDPAAADPAGEALDRLFTLLRDPRHRERCRRVAERHYNLEHAADRYDRVYQEAVVGAPSGDLA